VRLGRGRRRAKARQECERRAIKGKQETASIGRRTECEGPKSKENRVYVGRDKTGTQECEGRAG